MGLEEDFRNSGVLRVTVDIPNACIGGCQGQNSILPGIVLHVAPFTGQKRTLLSFSKAQGTKEPGNPLVSAQMYN